MIVISGALVLVALVLLVIGLIQPELGFVYASIAVSVAAFLFLIIGILQRRGEAPAGAKEPAEDSAPTPSPRPASSGGFPSLVPVSGGKGRSTEPAGATALLEVPAELADDDEPEVERLVGTVLVVAGRPRYHVEGCRYLSGRTPSVVDVNDALDEGFTPCGVCKPDRALAGPAGLDVADDMEQDVDEPVQEPVQPAPVRTRRTAARSAAGTGTGTVAAVPAPVPVEVEPVEADLVEADLVEADLIEEEPEPVAQQPAAIQEDATAAPSRELVGTVLVVPGRRLYHVGGCTYLSGRTFQEIDVRAAGDEGYSPCRICNPLVTLAGDAPDEPAVEPTREPADVAPEPVEPTPAPVRRPARKTPARPAAAAAVEAPVEAPDRVAAAPARTARTAPAKAAKAAPTPAVAPVQAPAKAAKAAPTPAVAPVQAPVKAPAKRASVVVIPNRGKFHTTECRYVRGAVDAVSVSKSLAVRQGYEQCGVCRP